MSKTRPVVMWVDPDFKRMVKVESAKNGVGIIDFTRTLAKKKSLLEDDDGGSLVERKPFRFRL